MVNISIDVMGAELGLDVVVNAAYAFVKKHPDVKFFFTGDGDAIKKNVTKINFPLTNFEIIHTSQVINQLDKITAIRRKKDSSMIKAIDLVVDGKADAVISGGASPVFLAACHFLIKEIPGIERPAFMPFIPNVKNGVTLLLDVGANLDNKSSDLYHFAKMSKVYMQEIFHKPNPKIGLINIGEEPTKGKEVQIAAYNLLDQDKDINFYGNIEPKYVFSGECDILVCDGYTGNIVLKTFEGTALTILGKLKEALTKNIWRKFCTLFVKFILMKFKQTFNYKKYNGALVIGLNKTAFKTHGSSDEESYYAVISMAYDNVKNQISEKIKLKIQGQVK